MEGMLCRRIVKDHDIERLYLVKSIIEIAKKLHFRNSVCIMYQYN